MRFLLKNTPHPANILKFSVAHIEFTPFTGTIDTQRKSSRIARVAFLPRNLVFLMNRPNANLDAE
jgi:hypothetical protein